MSNAPKVKDSAPAESPKSTIEQSSEGGNGTPAPASVSSDSTTKPLDLSSITIGQQPEPTGAPPDGDTPEPPVAVGGLDAEKKRGRGRPVLSEEAKRAKKSAEKSGARVAGSGSAKSDDAAPITGREISSDARSGAALVMQSLDFVRAVISDGEVDKGLSTDEAAKRAAVRESTENAWSAYLDECGAKLPPWAVVVVLSSVYVSPALRTPTAREKLGFAWSRVREWMKTKWQK